MPKIIVYSRVSTDEQAQSGLGLEAQSAACRAAAVRLALPIASTFRDDVSGGLPLDRRPILVEAIAALEPGDTLLVAKRDRLSRGDPFVTGMIELAVQRAGARIVSASGEGTEDDSPSAILMRRIIDAFGEHERLVIKARTKAALRAKKARGERAGAIPFGAAIDPEAPARSKAGRPCKLRIDPAEVEAIGMMHRWKAEGHSLRAIARKLDGAGVPTKGGRPWACSTVRKLLGRTTDAQDDQA